MQIQINTDNHIDGNEALLARLDDHRRHPIEGRTAPT